MGKQAIRQAARRAALDVTARKRAERIERERRIEDLVVAVLTAVAERDEAVAVAERRAGAAIRALTDAEGLTLREAVEWCGEKVSLKEATRLRRVAADGEAGDAVGECEGAAGVGTAVR